MINGFSLCHCWMSARRWEDGFWGTDTWHLPLRLDATRISSKYLQNWTATMGGKQPCTDLALSRRCLKRTRPPFSSAQPKVSPRFSSRASIPPPLPSSPNRSSSPLLGAWTRLKTSRSGGLSGSVTCSRVAGSGANAPRGTSREPLTCRTGGRLFAVEERKRNEYKNHFSVIILDEALREKVILELQVWFCFRDSTWCGNETCKKQWREGIERSMSGTLKSICQVFLFKVSWHMWTVADLPLRMMDFDFHSNMMEIWETERIMEDMKLRVSKVAPVHDRRECSWAATIRGRGPVPDRFWRTLKVDQRIIHANTHSTSCSDSERSSLESLQTNTCCMTQLHSPTSRRNRLTETQWRPRSLPSSLESWPSRDCLLAPAHFYYSLL